MSGCWGQYFAIGHFHCRSEFSKDGSARHSTHFSTATPDNIEVVAVKGRTLPWPARAVEADAQDISNRGFVVGRHHELITANDADSHSAVTASHAIEEETKPASRRKLPFGLTFSSDAALSQGFLSLADQAVASITNFVTGVIIARASSKEQFGLYMLGFSLILLLSDLQTSLIATPYMVFAPRLKGRAAALYAGSTLIHQAVFSVLAMLALACGALVTRFGVGPRGMGSVLWALSAVVCLILLREFVRRMCFASFKLGTVFLFDTCIGVGQIAGLLLLGRLGLVSASRAYWLVGSTCGIAVILWLWFDRRFYQLRLDEAVADLKKNWLFGKWVFASGLVWTAATNLYPWLLPPSMVQRPQEYSQPVWA